MFARSLFSMAILFTSCGCLKVSDRNKVQPDQKNVAPTASIFDFSKYSQDEILVIDEDFEFPASHEFIDWRAYKVIRLLNSAEVNLNGRDLRMQPELFESENAVIRSFAQGAKASLGPGRNGSRIDFEVGRARGAIAFILNGEGGANGADGASFDRRAEKGKPEQTEMRDPIFKQGNEKFCSIITLSGDGAPGADGRNGQSGGRGGDSGRLVYREIASTELEVHLENKPGQGGSGGKPGDGQEGGEAGDHNPQCFDLKLLSFPDRPQLGAVGPKGRPGEPGPDGLPGTPLQSCFSFTDKKELNHCR